MDTQTTISTMGPLSLQEAKAYVQEHLPYEKMDEMKDFSGPQINAVWWKDTQYFRSERSALKVAHYQGTQTAGTLYIYHQQHNIA